MGVADDIVGSTITVNTEQLWLYGENLGYAGILYNEAAQKQHGALAVVKEKANVVVFCAALTKNTASDIGSRAFSTIVQIDGEISRLEAERATALAGVTAASVNPRGDLTPEDVTRLINNSRSGINSSFDSLIQTLNLRRGQLVNFLNTELSPFVAKLDTTTTKAKDIFAGIDALNSFDIGHAYIGLRIYYAANTIHKYCDDVVINEDEAMSAFQRTLPTVEDPNNPSDPNSEVGADWRDIEAGLVSLAGSGYVPSNIENELGVPFHNTYEQGDPTSYEIANAYNEAGVYNGVSDEIQGWYSYYLRDNPNASYSDFSTYMVDLYGRGFPDTGSIEQADALTRAVNAYIAGNPSQRNAYSFFLYWWRP